jgi:hypothetical protein
LHDLYAERCSGSATDTPPGVLLVGPAAAGKTSLISQVVVHTVGTGLVPVVIKVQRLQSRMLEQPDVFATAWNWVDAYMRIEHEEPLYRMLRQLLIARRTLLLLDGLDEGGLHREQIERHVSELGFDLCMLVCEFSSQS